MQVPGYFYLVLIATVVIELIPQDVKATSVHNINAGLLTFNFVFAAIAAPQNSFSLPQYEVPEKNTPKNDTRTRSSLRGRVVRQFGFVAPALQTMGCLPKLFCGLNTKEPSDDTTTINDLSYLMKFAFTNELDDVGEENKGKDGHTDPAEILTPIQEQILEDQANEDLVYEDPHYLSFIWKDMVEREQKKKMNKNKRRQRSLELELDILLKTLEIDRNFNKFSDHFQKFRDIFHSNRQSRSQKTLESVNFNATDYIQSKQRQLADITDANKKLEVAAEAGGKLRSGRQCRLLFSTCPYTVEQMKQMIKTSNRTSTRTPPKVSPPIYDNYPTIKPPKEHNRDTPLFVHDPLQTYMTDDVYIENLDSEHHKEIQQEESDKINQYKKKKPRPPLDISVTVAPTSTYDADAQLMYLVLPESEIEMQQKLEALAHAQAGNTRIKSNEDDEANDQIIPQIQVEYTTPDDDKERNTEKSSEEIASSKESQEIEDDRSPENIGYLTSSEDTVKAPLLPSKEETHDDEISVLKDENKHMSTTNRPKFKYKIRNKNKENEDEDASLSEQDDASEEQKLLDPHQYAYEKFLDKEKQRWKNGNSQKVKSKITPMPPIFGEVKDATESYFDSSSSTISSSKQNSTSTEEDSDSDEAPSILPNKYHRHPHPTQNKYAHLRLRPVVQDDEKDLPPEPARRPLGPIANLGGNDDSNNKPNKFQAHPTPIPPLPAIYSKLPNSNNGYHPGHRPTIQRPNKKKPSSILSSILNFKVVAPKKRPTPRPRPQRPITKTPNKAPIRKEPLRHSLNAISLLGLGGIKNAFNRPNNNGRRPLPPPPPIYNGYFKFPQNQRPTDLKQPPVIEKPEFDDDIEHPPQDEGSSEEKDIKSDETSEEPPQIFDLGQLAQLGDDVVEQESPSHELPPPPIFGGGGKPDSVTESLLKPSKIQSDETKNDEMDKIENTNFNMATSIEREESASGSSEEDNNNEEETAQKSPNGFHLPAIGSNSPSGDKQNMPPPPPPVFNKWKPSQNERPQNGNTHGNYPLQRPYQNHSQQPKFPNNTPPKGSAEIENSNEPNEKSSEENVSTPENDKPQNKEPPRKPLIELANIGSDDDKPKDAVPPPPLIAYGSNNNVNKNEKSSEEQKIGVKDKDSGEDGSAEDTKNEDSDEDNAKQKSKEDTKDKDSEKQKSEEDTKDGDNDENEKSDEEDNKSHEDPKSDEEESEEIKESNNNSSDKPKPAKAPVIEIVSLGEEAEQSSVEHVVPPPPPVKLWAPSAGNLADDLASSSEIEKIPVAYMKPTNNLPPRSPPKSPRPIVQSTPPPNQSTKDQSSQGSPNQPPGGHGHGQGEGGDRNKKNGNKKKNNNNKKEDNEKDSSEENGRSSEEDSGAEEEDEDDDEEDDDSTAASSEEAQDDRGKPKRDKRKPGSVMSKIFNFPIGNSHPNPPGHQNKNPSEHVKRPAKLTIALPPIFKWRSGQEQGQKPRVSNNQRVQQNVNPNPNENEFPNIKIYKLSLSSSEESSKSYSASIESIKSESSRHERRQDLSEDRDEGLTISNSNNNRHNSQSEEIDSSRNRRLAHQTRRADGRESTIKISNKNAQFYSQPQSKKSQRQGGESQRRKAGPPLPPIYGKVAS